MTQNMKWFVCFNGILSNLFWSINFVFKYLSWYSTGLVHLEWRAVCALWRRVRHCCVILYANSSFEFIMIAKSINHDARFAICAIWRITIIRILHRIVLYECIAFLQPEWRFDTASECKNPYVNIWSICRFEWWSWQREYFLWCSIEYSN